MKAEGETGRERDQRKKEGGGVGIKEEVWGKYDQGSLYIWSCVYETHHNVQLICADN